MPEADLMKKQLLFAGIFGLILSVNTQAHAWPKSQSTPLKLSMDGIKNILKSEELKKYSDYSIENIRVGPADYEGIEYEAYYIRLEKYDTNSGTSDGVCFLLGSPRKVDPRPCDKAD
jgi:hypothetical protein